MKASFVEYSRVGKSLANKLLSPPPKSSKYKIGVVLINSKPELTYYYVLYNESTNVCQVSIQCSSRDIGLVVETLNKALSPNMWLWVVVPLSQSTFLSCLQNFVNKGFTTPYIIDVTPFKKKITHCVALTRLNVSRVNTNVNRTMLNVMYILQQYRSSGCSLHARFGRQAIRFLRAVSRKGHTSNGDKSVTQKELGGTLKVVSAQKSGGKFVFVIGVVESSVEPGVEEEVMVSPTRYNFHSHPKEAYVRHGVNQAWPSATDYLGYLKLGNNTIFHCVATLEGLYILSFGDYWVNKLKDVSKIFIQKHYNIDHKEKISPFEYVVRVNRIRYKGHRIFLVKFLPWNNAARTIFSINYKKVGMTCFPSEKLLDGYRKLYE